ncbi:MAG TPA: NAD-dependent epimerase/dehydratase family protein [Oligoflexia bacterium]|nr:NAD-dependent epimerase/dehydratase family protein [Oligoflexia bacterium]HMP48766.1 NAD-dependent epimerase/dehydratase family protein [Oligoflexia bacterium]
MVVSNLVTGGAGFIGAHVVRELLAKGEKVVVLDDLSGGFTENVPDEAEFVKGSILDHQLVDTLFEKHRFNNVYHLAAYAAEGLSHFIRRFNYQNNLIGSINLINASVKYDVSCFVFTSSIAVYGANQLPMSEDLIPQPEDPYGISKLAVEQDLKAAHEMFGLDYVIFRPHNVYGEFQNIGDKYRNVIGIFMNQIMQGLPLTVFGNGKQTRAFSYVGEISGIIASAPENTSAYGEVFNVGADTPYSVTELAREVCSVFGVEPNINYLDARNEVLHAYSSHDKVKKYFPGSPQFGLREGLEKMAAWAKEHGPRKSPEFGEIEVEKNMPASWRK